MSDQPAAKLDLTDRRSRLQRSWDRLPWSWYQRTLRHWKRKWPTRDTEGR